MLVSNSFEFTSLGPNPYALGMAAEFISRFTPFADFGFGATINAVAFQLNHNFNIIVSQDDKMAGYVGWIPTTEEVAVDWLRLGGVLQPSAKGDAIVITILAATDAACVRPLLKALRKQVMGKKIYWNRYFDDGRLSTFRTLKIRAE